MGPDVDGILVRGDAVAALAEIAAGDRLFVLPVTLGVNDMAKLFGRTPTWVRQQVQARTFPIARIDDAPILLWSRQQVERWLRKPTYKPLKRAS